MTGETELAKWLRLHWIDADMHRAGVRLRTDTRLHSLDLPNIAWATGLTWPAVRALVLDNEDKLTIGHHYESGDRAAKAVALHMVRAGLETMAKCYGITPNNSHNI
jgi:hypothetical protein